MTETALSVVDTPQDPTNKLVISVDLQDRYWDYEPFGLTFNSTEDQVLTAIESAVQEEFGVSLRDRYGNWAYKTRKKVNSENIFIFPNSTAGK